ncbi:MAG: hypothetical protein H5T83_01505 [Actinotalea sp.]|nr:hypothetical protein [Actinotalea sp.]
MVVGTAPEQRPAGARAGGPPDRSHDASSDARADVPAGGPADQVSDAPSAPARRRRRRARLAVGAALAAGLLAVWELGAVHDDGPLLRGETWGWGSCHTRSGDEVDWTIGGVLAEPSADVVVQKIRPYRPQNLVVQDGVALPFLGDRDGDGTRTVVGEGAGYPPEDLTGTDVVWAQGDPLVGAVLPRGAATNLVWHAQVQDPTLAASYEAIQIEYRSGHRRYVAVVQHQLLITGQADPDACD